MIERHEQLEGRRLAPGETFCFQCRPGLACFNTCCRDKRLPLLPYDLLRLRRGLGLSSEEILETLVLLETDPVSGWPALRLALGSDGRCPFVGDAGCAVYADRPTCCRIYPLARALRAAPDGGHDEVFLVGDAPGCLGWNEPQKLTVQHWVDQQGLEPYQRANNALPRFFLHPRRRRPMRLQEGQVHAILLTLYNLDVFREALSNPAIAANFGLSGQDLRQSQATDETLLDLGLEWLIRQFFGAPTE